jgi:arabinan endo-1,5-alpha-L-arabinosidase
MLSGIYQIPMSDPLTIASTASPQNMAFNPAGNHPVEGSYQFWWPVDGVDYYYLFLSVGICCNTPPNLPAAGQEYHINVCRSTSPTGPFIDQTGLDCMDGGGTLLLGSHDNVYAPGGQGVIYDPNLESIVLYYHYINPTIGYNTEDYQFGYNLLSFGDDGWPVVSS